MTAELKKWSPLFYRLSLLLSTIFTNSNKKKTCLLLCLLCIFKFQTLTCQNFWTFYFTLRLTLYKCVVNVSIQQHWIWNWTITRGRITVLRQDHILVRFHQSRRTDSYEWISLGDVSQWPREKKSGKKSSKCKALLFKKWQHAIHGLDTHKIFV